MTTKDLDQNGLTRRSFLQMSGLAASGLLIGACGDDADPTTTASATTAAPAGTDAPAMTVPQSDLEVVSFDFNTPNVSLQAPFWVGISKGYFEEVGIDLRAENITHLDDYLPPMFAGEIDIALMDATILFPAEDAGTLDGSPPGLRWTSCILGAQPIIMIGSEGVTPDNLEGLTIGCARAGTTNEVLAKYVLEELGYDWETDVNCVNLTGGSNDWVTAMLTGQVDATLAFPRHVALAEEQGGGAVYNKPRLDPQAGLGMLQSTIDEYPGFATAFIYAYIKSQQWVKDPANWDEARLILVDEFGIDYPDNTFAAMEIDAGIMTADLGWNPDDMDTLMEFQQPLGGYRAGLPWRDYVDLTHLHAAQGAMDLSLNPVDVNTGVSTI